MKFHTSLPVSNIEKTVEFYSVLFGVQPTKHRSDYAKFLPEDPEINITFHQAQNPDALLTDLHLGFELHDQTSLDAAYERLKDAGLITEERETSVCCYANQDKFWVTDPNGYKWELYRVVNDADYKMDRASGCCGGDASCKTEGKLPASPSCC